jgi:hypothetical protein
MIGVGTALGIIAQKAEEAGNEELAKSLSGWSTALTSIGAILMTLPSIIKGVKVAWTALNAAV